MNNKEHHYTTTIKWKGETSSYSSYSRDHEITVEGKRTIQASSDPNFKGNPSLHNPEELFLASVANCHMLWYLHLCAKNGIIVSHYADKAQGTMIEEENGSGRFTSITLHPQVKIEDYTQKELATQLHHEANKYCFIANTLNIKVHHLPLFT